MESAVGTVPVLPFRFLARIAYIVTVLFEIFLGHCIINGLTEPLPKA
jgi:hypothetical protein